MRFVLVDEDHLMVSMVEGMLRDLGHEVVGVVGNTADAVHLLHTARPDVVIIDMSLGYNTDFDALGAALDVGAHTIVFAFNAEDAVLSRYRTRPAFVPKPDLTELERVVARLRSDHDAQVGVEDRRSRPVREAAGRVPTSLVDSEAFYDAVNAAVDQDALVSILLGAGGHSGVDPDTAAHRARGVLRKGDRLLESLELLRFFLPGAAEDGVASCLARLEAAGAIPEGAKVSWVVVQPGEPPSDAFARLKQAGSGPEPA